MQLAAVVGAQSAVERANGLLWLTGGNVRRNNLSMTSRLDTAFVSQKFRKTNKGWSMKKRAVKDPKVYFEDGWSDEGEYADLKATDFGLTESIDPVAPLIHDAAPDWSPSTDEESASSSDSSSDSSSSS